MAWVTISELKEGMVVEAKVGVAPYLVTKIENGFATLQNADDTFTDNDGYVKVINKMPKVDFMRNLESGTIHATINGRAICNTRHSQNSETTDRFTNCEKCIKLFEEK